MTRSSPLRLSPLVSTLAAALTAACAAGGPRTVAAPPDDRTPVAPAGVTLDDRIDTYPVAGRTVAEVRRALSLAAPDATGTAFRGIEHYSLGWIWRASASPGTSCQLRDVAVTVTSRITVPAWVPDSTANPGLPAQWTAYDAALRRHERGHEVLAIRAASDLVRKLREVRGSGCAFATNDGNRIGRDALDALRVAERQYDDSTGHGRTQGASWPPPVVARGEK